MIAVSAGVEPSGSLVWSVRASGMDSGATTDKISSRLVTGVAPCLISNNEMNVSLLSRLAQEREEDLSWMERQARLSLADSRKIIDEYRIFLKGGEEASPLLHSLFSEALKEWSNINDGLETVINNATQEELIGEQTQLADLYDTEEVNTNDDAEE